MINLHRCVCHLLRMPRTYGFGVQSPFAYRFIREIVVGHTPGRSDFCSSDVLAKELSGLSKRERRICQFIYRLCRFSNAGTCFVSSDLGISVLMDVLCSMDCSVDHCIHSLDQVMLSFISPIFQEYDTLLNRMAFQGILVVYGIRKYSNGLDYWNNLVSDCRSFVSFDLYDLGVIFFDSKMHKRNYCCNIG